MSQPITAAGIDIGGTKVQSVVMDSTGKILGKGKRFTGIGKKTRTESDFMDAILGSLDDALESAGVASKKLSAIGIGCAGQIQDRTGDVLNSPHLKWAKFPLGRLVRKATGLRPAILNDVQAAAWGEYAWGAGRGAKVLACVFVGTGIGSGVVIDGKLFRGVAGSAGEVGHSHYKLNGVKCQCGQHGCAEAYAGGESLWLRARQAILRGTKSRIEKMAGGDLDNIRADIIFKAAKAGDPLATKLWKDAESAVGVICHNFINILNPDVIVLGGGIVEGIPELRDFARKYALKRAVPTGARSVKIVAPKLGYLSPAVGAADYASFFSFGKNKRRLKKK